MIFRKENFICLTFLLVSCAWTGLKSNGDAPSNNHKQEEIIQEIAQTIKNDTGHKTVKGEKDELSFKDIAKTVFSSCLVIYMTDQPLLHNIALATSIQIFYYFLWKTSFYQENAQWLKDRVNYILDHYELREYTIIDQLIAWKPILCNPVVFGITTALVTWLCPTLYVSYSRPSWWEAFKATTKQKLFPQWMTQRYAPMLERASGYVPTNYSTIKTNANHIAQKAQSWGNSLLKNAGSMWNYVTG